MPLRNRLLPLARVAVAALVLAGCSQIRVQSDYNPRADFARLRTYAWLSDPQIVGDPRIDSPLLDRRIRAAVERHLAAKGYQKLEDGVPSFRVAYHVYLQRKTQLVAEPVGPYSYRWWGGMTTVRTYEYDEGTLVLDVVDPQTDELMWRGTASATVDPHASVEKREERVDRAVSSILEKFPPKSS